MQELCVDAHHDIWPFTTQAGRGTVAHETPKHAKNTQNNAHFNPPRRQMDAKSHETSTDDSTHIESRTRVEKSHK